MFRVVLILQCLAFTEAFVSYPSSVALSKKCVGIMPLKKPSGMQGRFPALKADLNSFAPVLHEAAALADGKINLNAEIISNFFNQPSVVGVGTVLAASFIERKAEKYADKKIEVILLSFEIPLSFNDTFDFALQVVLESLETLTTKVDKITEHLGINATDP